MKKLLELALLLLGTCGFFGFLYPELILTEDNFVIEAEDFEEWDQQTILQMKKEEIQIKFKIIEILNKKED